MSSFTTIIRRLPVKKLMNAIPSRQLNLLEYQSKNLLRKHGVAIQDFCMVDKNGDSALREFNAPEYVIKAQILAGGRGKGHFSNGYKGGVQITKDKSAIKNILDQMLGHRLITKQTPKQGIEVQHIMVARSVNITRETYVCIVMDRQSSGPVIVASPAGGMDIEAVAEKTPHLLKTLPIDIHTGITLEMANELADFLEFRGPLQSKAAMELQRLWQLFLSVDAVQIEINPLCETDDGQVIAVDAKLNFDDNARFRQRDVFAMEDSSESDPREVEATKHDLNYIGMTGNIGCLVNGAGLAMATMDIITLHGGSPANFLDVGGNVREQQVQAAFSLLRSDPNVKAILVNVFGGIVNCATIANGIVQACKSMKLDLPLIVRLEGTNVQEAKRIIKESGLLIEAANDLEDAAQKAVRSTRK